MRIVTPSLFLFLTFRIDKRFQVYFKPMRLWIDRSMYKLGGTIMSARHRARLGRPSRQCRQQDGPHFPHLCQTSRDDLLDLSAP